MGARVEFRLTYDGPLLGASRTNTRADHKQKIREQFHPQLRELWRVHPFLHSLSTNEHYSNREWYDIGRDMGKNNIGKDEREIGPSWLQRHADSFERGGIRFAPL